MPTELLPEICKPFVSLILQGEKRLMVGSEMLHYAAGQTFTASMALPIIGEIVRASTIYPYLAVSLTFDPTIVADLLCHVPDQTEMPDERGFGVGAASDYLVDAWLRMLRLIERPDEIAVMAPMLEREILFRLLRGPQNAFLRQVAGIDGRFSQIKKALAWMRSNYAAPFHVEDLARIAGMSASSFHRRFKLATGLAPLQYQKHLRLYEARRILFAEAEDAASAAFLVGYESASQFTREYARMFGAPPARDIRRLRANTNGEPAPPA